MWSSSVLAPHALLPDTMTCCQNIQAGFYFPFYLLPSALGLMVDVPPMSKSMCGSIPSPPKGGYHLFASWSPLVPWFPPVPAPSPDPR